MTFMDDLHGCRAVPVAPWVPGMSQQLARAVNRGRSIQQAWVAVNSQTRRGEEYSMSFRWVHQAFGVAMWYVCLRIKMT